MKNDKNFSLSNNASLSLGVADFDSLVNSATTNQELLNILCLMNSRIKTNPQYVLPKVMDTINYISVSLLDKSNKITTSNHEMLYFYEKVLEVNQAKLNYVGDDVYKKIYEIAMRRKSDEIFNNIKQNKPFKKFLANNRYLKKEFLEKREKEREEIEKASNFPKFPEIPQNKNIQQTQELPNFPKLDEFLEQTSTIELAPQTKFSNIEPLNQSSIIDQTKQNDGYFTSIVKNQKNNQTEYQQDGSLVIL